MPSHGSTFAWWSRPVRTISSPGSSAAAIERLRWNVRVVMFGPNVISWAASAPSMSAAARWASAEIASLRSLVRNVPPEFAFDSR
jgi:hypothetical protein